MTAIRIFDTDNIEVEPGGSGLVIDAGFGWFLGDGDSVEVPEGFVEPYGPTATEPPIGHAVIAADGLIYADWRYGIYEVEDSSKKVADVILVASWPGADPLDWKTARWHVRVVFREAFGSGPCVRVVLPEFKWPLTAPVETAPRRFERKDVV